MTKKFISDLLSLFLLLLTVGRECHANYQSTEISKILQNQWDSATDQLIRNSNPNLLLQTQQAFYASNITQLSQLPETTLEIVELMKKIPASPSAHSLIQKSFNLKAPQLYTHLLAGFSYDLLTDQILLTSPLDFSKFETIPTELGYKIPSYLVYKNEKETQDIFYYFSTMEEYLNKRLELVGAKNIVKSSAFEGKLRLGYNVEPQDGADVFTIIGIREKQTFSLEMEPESSWKNFISEDFKNRVSYLSAFDSSDRESEKEWKIFFNEFGTHMVIKAYGGGYIQGSVQSVPTKYTKRNVNEVRNELKKSLLLENLELPQKIKRVKNVRVSHAFYGGFPKPEHEFIFQNTREERDAKLREWEETINLRPVMLQTKLELKPLSEIIGIFDREKSILVQNAVELLLKGELIYKRQKYKRSKPKESNDEGEAPVVVPCDCSSIKLSEKECGRGYLEKPCSDCSALYTNFNESSKNNYLNRAFIDSTFTSLIARSGCTLNVKFTNGVDTFTKTVHGGKVEDWSRRISEYRCECDSSSGAELEAPIIDQNSNFPPLIEIPDKSITINSLLRKYPNHPGLTAALQSISNKRSGKNAYIMLLGLSGAGKSSTINFLFDNSSITKVGDMSSTTSDIHEYRINVPVRELGINNSELRIIDTPGLVDTRGMEQDAKFLATLDQYLASHPELKKSLPNVVLIFTKFNDNRFGGIGSNFVKMLRSIDLFRERIIDKHFSNVIFVLTHTMSESREILKDTPNRLNKIQKVIEEFSLLPKPISIVLAENRPSDDVPQINGFYLLPNNELYPKNLFEKIQLSCLAGGDLIGESIIRTAFKNSLKGSGVKEEVVFAHVSPEHKKVTHYLGLLSEFNVNSITTDVTKELGKAWKNLDENVKKTNPDALSKLENLLTLLNIREFKSIPQTQKSILLFFQKVQKDPATLELLETGLNLTVPEFEKNPLVGHPYSISKDKALPTNLLKSEHSKFYISDSGYKFPSLYKCTLLTGVKTFFNIFPNRKYYVDQRLKNLGLAPPKSYEKNNSLLQNENGRLRGGYNLVQNETTGLNENRLSAVIEYRIFQLKLNDESLTLSDEFLADLKKLEPFNETKWEVVTDWRYFFEKYGTHLIKSAAGGGALEIIIETKKDFRSASNENESVLSIQEKLMSGMSYVIEFLANLVIGKEMNFELHPSLTYQLYFQGGQSQFHLKSLSSDQVGQYFNNWRESLVYEPIILDNELELISLVNLVPKAELEKFEEGLERLFQNSLVYENTKSDPTEGNIFEDRTSTSSAGTAGDYATMKEFSTLLSSLSQKSKETYENLVLKMSESNAKIAAEYEAQKEANKLAAQKEAQRAEEQAQILKNERLSREEREKCIEEERRRRILAREQIENEENRIRREEDLAYYKLEAQKNEELMRFVEEENRRCAASQQNTFLNRAKTTFDTVVNSAVIGFVKLAKVIRNFK